jgi:hypothetical protein
VGLPILGSSITLVPVKFEKLVVGFKGLWNFQVIGAQKDLGVMFLVD